MLRTDVTQVETREQVEELVKSSKNVMICCGRMGPMCIPVYEIMNKIQSDYPHVQMRAMDFDVPGASVIRELPECASFRGLPFTVYYKDGKVVQATTSIQNETQVKEILDRVFSA